jgi:hypothetical protein
VCVTVRIGFHFSRSEVCVDVKVARREWLALWKPDEFPLPDPNDRERVRKFIRMTYIEKRWVRRNTETNKEKEQENHNKSGSSKTNTTAHSHKSMKHSSTSFLFLLFVVLSVCFDLKRSSDLMSRDEHYKTIHTQVVVAYSRRERQQ